MSTDIRFDDRVVIVTGAGNGLGRSHAHLFAAHGAKVVVNDLGGSHLGEGQDQRAADEVVAEIQAAGGEAVANYDSVTDGEKIVQTALDEWGRIDVIVNNAGILRDVSFHKMTQEDWDKVYAVHVLGAMKVTHAAWPHMREQRYGRVIMTSSAAGIYGNFGQANYAMAKLGLYGLGSTLAIEGLSRGIHVNTIAPLAGSRMTETILPPQVVEALRPEYVSGMVVWLCHESCTETGGLYEVGGGYMGKVRWQRAKGQTWRIGRSIAPEDVRDHWPQITDFEEVEYPEGMAEAFGPILNNIQKGPSRGKNEFIDVDLALGYEYPESESTYDERDVSLYALGVGAARDAAGADLQLVYELHGQGFRVIPSFGVIPAMNIIYDLAKSGTVAPGLNYGLERMLHGEQYTKLERPLPARARLKHRAKIIDIQDKKKGALVVTEIKSYDEQDALLVTNEFRTFVRGAGGWRTDDKKESRPAVSHAPPDRVPDFAVEEATRPDQGLLYRLSGDWNPLHADPSFAQAMKFDGPIL
ncbi:MAG: SDR family NAD(P)-dependent oxidoreductase, partial [Myxococcota bacterium]